MEKHFALFKNFLLFKEQEKISLAKHMLLLVFNLDLSIARFISSSKPSNVLLIWLIRNLLQVQDEEIQNIKLSFSSPDLWNNIKSPKIDNTTNINNTSNYNTKCDTRCDNVPSQLGNIPKTEKDLPSQNKLQVDDVIDVKSYAEPVTLNVNNNNNTTTHVIILVPINVSSNSTINNDSDQSSSVGPVHPYTSTTPMDTSSSNDSLIKKANNKKKKKIRQEPAMDSPTDIIQQLLVPTDMLIDISEQYSPELFPPKDEILDHLSSIPKEIMDITFNKIITESIDRIVDQLDSTHLSESYKSHSFTPSLTSSSSQVGSSIHLLSFDARVAVQRAQVAIKKDPCIKNIKAIKHKKEYLKSIKAEESSSNQNIKLDSAIKNHEELLAFIELFMRQFDHFSSVNYCSTESVPSVIVKFSKHEGLIKAANHFKHGHHTGRMKLISKTYYRMGRDKVSCREFKIINVPININLNSVEQAIRSILKGEPFYLRHPFKHVIDNRSGTKDIFFTASSSTACNLLKQTWSISIDKDVFRLIPAYFKKSDIELRNSHVGKFSGFFPNHDLVYIKDNLQAVTNLKNVYRRTDDNNIYLEFSSESDLFNACSSNIFIDNIKIKGIPRGTNWNDRDTFLNSHCNKCRNSSSSSPLCATSSNRIPISSP
ncbi:hypothetical protein C1645_828740 [Glomus cerebriforme]|uniref:RRM domain-containing protein n=1 Tax=Glomus cerebriforme TaxID=658196 RepID=A0A397SPD2_9GLOM|nr:hypothetical protein C1645_828740 [Glomus cerebriforme]